MCIGDNVPVFSYMRNRFSCISGNKQNKPVEVGNFALLQRPTKPVPAAVSLLLFSEDSRAVTKADQLPELQIWPQAVSAGVFLLLTAAESHCIFSFELPAVPGKAWRCAQC